MGWQPSYTTTEDLASFVRIGDTADDVQLGLAISASSRAIDQRCRRQFGAVAAVEARDYTARWSRSRGGWLVPVDDFQTSTGLEVAVDEDGDGTHELEVTTHRLRPSNAASAGVPWTELLIPVLSGTVGPTPYGPGAVRVTALWGWTAIPPAIEQACLLQASRLLSRRDSPYGIAGSPDTGSEMRLLSRLDPDVAVAVEPYRRRTWAA
jgi:hypothetical protein